MKQSNKDNAIHDAVCDQLGVNIACQNESVDDGDGQETVCGDETYICSECKEWTSEEDSCCGVGPSNHEYESDYER
jgi:hypothetical protein